MFQGFRQQWYRLQARYRQNNDGSMAIEFAAVVIPFLMLLMGTVVVGLYFFVTFSLEHAVEQASRQIRTGQAQLAGMTKDQFKANVCSHAPSFIDCTTDLRVNVIEVTGFNTAIPTSCVDGNGNLIANPADDPVPGQAGEVVLVMICYEWKLAGSLPFLDVGSMSNGSALIQAATAFRTEPYS
ncbi:MAG: TadE/TadG family type IV pilus assembly protein [Pseudomonadota bacterium]